MNLSRMVGIAVTLALMTATSSRADVGEYGVLRGRVIDAGTGSPVAGATVTQSSVDIACASDVPCDWWRRSAGSRMTATTDANGFFAFTADQPGAFAISVSYDPGDWKAARSSRCNPLALVAADQITTFSVRVWPVSRVITLGRIFACQPKVGIYPAGTAGSTSVDDHGRII